MVSGDNFIRAFDDDLLLFNSEDPITRDRIKIMCDSDQGGFSRASLDIVEEVQSNLPQTPPPTPHPSSRNNSPDGTELSPPIIPAPEVFIPKTYGLFHGTISTQLPGPKWPTIQRSGFAGWRTEANKRSILGKRFFDIECYNYLAFRVRSDGRTYFVNVQGDSIEEKDLHQHRLFTRKIGEWETVLIGTQDFVRTEFGFVVEDQKTLMTQRVKTIGLSVTDRIEGPFRLAIHSIWATNHPPPDSMEEVEVDVEDGSARRREKLDWGM